MGAVPILLGTYILGAHVAGGARLYQIVVVVAARPASPVAGRAGALLPGPAGAGSWRWS
jgi:hypothetical protein